MYELRGVIDEFCAQIKIPTVSNTDLQELFKLFDYDGNGKITIGEFKVMLEILGGIRDKMAKGTTSQYKNTSYN